LFEIFSDERKELFGSELIGAEGFDEVDNNGYLDVMINFILEDIKRLEER
jgi:hypothetical protein